MIFKSEGRDGKYHIKLTNDGKVILLRKGRVCNKIYSSLHVFRKLQLANLVY
jgi:hypothetical protein